MKTKNPGTKLARGFKKSVEAELVDLDDGVFRPEVVRYETVGLVVVLPDLAVDEVAETCLRTWIHADSCLPLVFLELELVRIRVPVVKVAHKRYRAGSLVGRQSKRHFANCALRCVFFRDHDNV